MNNTNYIQKYEMSISTLVISVIVLSIIISISIPNGYAAPRDPRYGVNSSCDTVYDKKEKKYNETCCWREMVPGQILGNTYCQTCEKYTNNCGDKVLQRHLAEQTKPMDPLVNNDIVTENPTPLHPSSPTSDSGVIVREPLQQLESNNNDNGVDDPFSGDSQSKSDDDGDTDTQQKSDVSDKSDEFSNSGLNSKDNRAV
jgi:hypothetical protein